MLKAILFDLDNTLFPRDQAFESWLEDTVARTETRERLTKLDASGLSDRDRFFEEWTKETGRELNQADFVEGLLRYIKPNDELLGALRELSEKYLTGLLTNGGRASQRNKIKSAGFDGVFPEKHIWISAELGMEKPDPRIFQRACRDMEIEPGDCLYIGDQEDIDGVGAKAAGLQFMRVWT